MIANIIDTLNKGQSLSPILNDRDEILSKLKPYLK